MTVSLIGAIGWQETLLIFAAVMLLILPLSFAVDGNSGQGVARNRSGRRCRKPRASLYGLLVLGFFTCGFQLAFITIHLPAYLVDRGLSSEVGGWTIAAIGLFNVFGSPLSGWLSNLMPKRYILSIIYFGRALAVLAFITFPLTPLSSVLFGAVMGFLWLSTVDPPMGSSL